MAWNELDATGCYYICFRVGNKRFKRSLQTDCQKQANNLTARVEENLRDLERGRLVLPENADVVAFLLSDGRVTGPLAVVDRTTLQELFDAYFKAIPKGSLEESTIYGMKLHRKQLEKHFRPSFPIRTLNLEHLQGYVSWRTNVSPATIKKEIVTLRTVWNWGTRSKMIEGPYPARGLKYPKSEEKLPFMSFAEVEERTKGMSDKDAAPYWECVFLTVDDITELLKHVEKNPLPFLYPMICCAFHTGARRSELLRARVSDVDLKGGWITIRERKRVHGQNTTRRVPITAALHAVLTAWLAKHPGGDVLFCHGPVVARSKKRSETTGHRWKRRPKTVAGRLATVHSRPRLNVSPITRNEAHDHFKRAVAGTRWEKLKGWHVARHSFISALAASGCPQHVTDELSGHRTQEQRARYRHVLPNTTKESIRSAFG